MPRNVRRIAWLWCIALIVEIVGMLAASTFSLEVIAGAMVLCLAIFFPLFWVAVWSGRNWARWVLLLAFFGLIPFDFVDVRGVVVPLLLSRIYVASDIVRALGFYFLFTGDARPWFSLERSK